MKKVKFRKINKNSGSTMVETLVSFVVLFVVLAALYGIVSFSSELYMKSVDTSRLYQKFYQEVYKYPSGEIPAASMSEDTDFLFIQKYTPGYESANDENDVNKPYASLYLEFDRTKTDGSNYQNDTRISDAYISISNTGVTSFECNDEDAKKDELILPKAIHFWWRNPAGN